MELNTLQVGKEFFQGEFKSVLNTEVSITSEAEGILMSGISTEDIRLGAETFSQHLRNK